MSQIKMDSAFKETYTTESQAAAEKWKTLENDEQSLEQLKDDLEKMEHERNQINQDKIACRDKLDKGRKLIDELALESTSWKKELATIAEEFEHLLGNILVYAASICLLPAFHADKRYNAQLQNSIGDGIFNSFSVLTCLIL